MRQRLDGQEVQKESISSQLTAAIQLEALIMVIRPSVCPSIRPSIYPSIHHHLPVRPSIHLPVHPFIHLSIIDPAIHPSIHGIHDPLTSPNLSILVDSFPFMFGW